MRFRKKFIGEVTGHLAQFGLKSCPICGGEVLTVDRRPTLLSVGGVHHEPDDPRRDPEANVIFALKVQCEACGHVLLFDSERHRGGDDKIFFKGSLEDEAKFETEHDDG